MARKAVLEGGKRDEIIAAAEELFFREGYENTSVRMILEKVGGEVGMFYHYFRSKEELFDIVTERFFARYVRTFEELTEGVTDTADFPRLFLPVYETAMSQYRQIEGHMHWTVRFAMHDMTLLALLPAVERLLARSGYHGRYALDIAARRILADISAVIHSPSFEAMDREEKKQLLIRLIDDTLAS